MAIVRTVEELEAIYGELNDASRVKVTDHITSHYRRFIEASPFALLATGGHEGLDCSPRGDKPGFVRIADPKTLMLPDRRGNNRIDSLRNIVRDPRTALLFLIPGVGNTLRVNGHAHISTDAALLQSFAVEGMTPRSVIVLSTEDVYFQCARALVRSDLWNSAGHIDPKSLPSAGEILAALTDRIDGDLYDREWPERAKKTLW